MLEAMRELALDFLHDKLGGSANESPEVFYNRIRVSAPERLFPFLVENVEDVAEGKDKPRFYTLRPADDDLNVAILDVFELKASDAAKLPFNQSSGPNSPALGPVVKRTAKKGGELNSPKKIIQERTLAYFKEIADGTFPWSSYFGESHACWNRPALRCQTETKSEKDRTAYSLALDRILEKKTVIVAFKDSKGRLPGEVPEYVDYLRQLLAETKYLSDSTIKKDVTCPLCGAGPVDGYPNALRGAGINLGNVNRAGAFPGIDASSAWKSFALCIGCADLLYMFCKHVADTFMTRVAGEKALALPTLNVTDTSRKRFVTRLRQWIADAPKTVASRERQLLKALGEDISVNSITLIWATFGNRIEEIVGVVTDVLPSRLNELSVRNLEFEQLRLPTFPDVHLEEFEYDLSLSMVWPLLHRPGGKKAKSRNEIRRLSELRHDVADAIYHARPLPWERFWAEVHETARWHWDAACESDNCPYGLLYEGWSKKKNEAFLTAAGWVRQLARFLHYCRTIGGYDMSEPAPPLNQPGCELLRPYLSPESGIDSHAKRFAFVLGLLYGKLLQVQAARGVNVTANSLTWLRRLTLAGKDLPELYTKVREKMLIYGTEANPAVRELNVELAELVAHLRGYRELGEIDTCFFLLLGQSLAVKVLPSKSGEEQGDADA